MFNHPYYPPPWQMPQQGPDQQKYIEFGMKQAEKLMLRDSREKERFERNKKTNEINDRKEASARRGRTLLSIEWYILGIFSYQLWAPLYQMAILKAQNP